MGTVVGSTVNAWRCGSNNQGLICYKITKYLQKKCSRTLWSSICILCPYWFSIYKRIKKQSTGQSLPLACFHCVFCFIMLLSCGAVWWWWWDYNFHCYLCCGELMMAGTDPGLAPANLIICCCTLHLRCQQSPLSRCPPPPPTPPRCCCWPPSPPPRGATWARTAASGPQTPRTRRTPAAWSSRSRWGTVVASSWSVIISAGQPAAGDGADYHLRGPGDIHRPRHGPLRSRL